MKKDWLIEKKARFYWCYSKKFAFFLIEVKGLDFITEGISTKDGREFVLFEKTEEFHKADKEYQQLKSRRWEDLEQMKHKK